MKILLFVLTLISSALATGCSGEAFVPSPAGEGVVFTAGDSILTEPKEYPEYLDARYFVDQESVERDETAIAALRAVREKFEIAGKPQRLICLSIMNLRDRGIKEKAAYKFALIIEVKLVAAFLADQPDVLLRNAYWVQDPIMIDPETGLLINNAIAKHYRETTGEEPKKKKLPTIKE